MSGTSQYNAARFQQKPIPQPSYSFANVPKCVRNLEGSCLQRVTDRDHFKEVMAEMILLCNEAVRRNKSSRASESKKKSSKPLSLEYIADRLDVDDPISGYLVRSEGRLQGFVTLTTFTNWQETFRWDSMHENAYSYDDEEQARLQKKGIRKVDRAGKLAEALQATVRCGDPWNEGIVWPRIAEISLLGGLGCGKALVSLVIEELECMKPSENQNYDYVVLQATENSIPFYESLGFVRVGAVTEDLHFNKKESDSSKDNDGDTTITEDTITVGTITDGTRTDDDGEVAVALPVCEDPKDQDDSIKQNTKGRDKSDVQPDVDTARIVSSPLTIYKTKKAGETPNSIARKFGVSVWDIIFLNRPNHPKLSPGSRLIIKTIIEIPDEKTALEHATSSATRHSKLNCKDPPQAPLWFIAKENDTPRTIAKMFGVKWKDIVKGNIDRLPELESNSRLRQGTRIKVSHFDVPDDKHVPYCHWTFPDDKFETCDPSYMMARKLNRCNGVDVATREFHSSLAVAVSPYEQTPLLLPASPVKSKAQLKLEQKKKGKHPDEPKPPAKPLNAYKLFCKKQRELLSTSQNAKSVSEISTALKIAWKELPTNERNIYEKASEKAHLEYDEAEDLFRSQLAEFKSQHPDYFGSDESDLFCKVVKLKPEAANSEFKYWFVLTFIPDLKWCHLAPMRQDGMFKDEYPNVLGRPRWRLVDESLGKELDISSRLVIPVEASTMKQSDDADEEEWDIVEVKTSDEGRKLKRRIADEKKKKTEKKKLKKKSIEKHNKSWSGVQQQSANGTKESSLSCPMPTSSHIIHSSSDIQYFPGAGNANMVSAQLHGAQNWQPIPSYVAPHPPGIWAPHATPNWAPPFTSTSIPGLMPDYAAQPVHWGAPAPLAGNIPPAPHAPDLARLANPALGYLNSLHPPYNVSSPETYDGSYNRQDDLHTGFQWGSSPIRGVKSSSEASVKRPAGKVNQNYSNNQSNAKVKKKILKKSGPSSRCADMNGDGQPVVSATDELDGSGSESTLTDPETMPLKKRSAAAAAATEGRVTLMSKRSKTVPNIVGSDSSSPSSHSTESTHSSNAIPRRVQRSVDAVASSDYGCGRKQSQQTLLPFLSESSRKARKVK